MLKRVLVFLAAFLVLVPLFSYLAYYQSVHRANELSASQQFEISPGEGVKEIGAKLLSDKLIASTFFFEIYVWREKVGSKLQAGKYEILPEMSIVDIVAKFIGGEVLEKERTVKILEGWTIADMEKYLSDNGFVFSGEFAKLARTPIGSWPFSFEKPGFLEDMPGDNLEGYLFPDTYRIFEDASAEDLIRKMSDNFAKKLDNDLRADIERQGKSLHDVITMASIIEKEVRTEKDAAIVSGILYKRLENGMRLEVDSSVNYATGKSSASASYEDLQIDSPYNTYRNDGLPPGPICSPGLWAIRAAVYPEDSPYFFYLNRQDTGETIFSKDFEEHVRNKNKYLK